MTQNSINNEASEFTVDNLFLDGNTISSLDTNGDISLSPDGTGDVIVTASPVVPSTDRADSLGSTSAAWSETFADGISFDDGTNVLSTYTEKASWTPVLVGQTSAGVGTYTTNTGTYSRIGDMVKVSFTITWTAHTGSGTMVIQSLPVAVSTAQLTRSTGAIVVGNGTTLPANTLWTVAVTANGSANIFLQACLSTGGVSSLQVSSSGTMTGSIWYFA